MERAAYLFTD
jgi:hypothetical protein